MTLELIDYSLEGAAGSRPSASELGAQQQDALPKGAGANDLRDAIADLVREATTLGHVRAKGYETDKVDRCFSKARARVDALLAAPKSASAGGPVEVKGAWIDGGYVIVTPALGIDARAVKAAILERLATPSEQPTSRKEAEAIAEQVKQVIYALERAERRLTDDADRLSRERDYSAEFPSEDAARMREAIALLRTQPAAPLDKLDKSEGSAMREGWAFYSADFSANATDFMKPGTVKLIRTGRARAAWNALSEEERKIVPLYACGIGWTFEEAMQAAVRESVKGDAP